MLGNVEKICRYPVKSMAGQEVDKIYVHETGLNGDRVFALYDPNSKRAGLPYFTAREDNTLLLLKPRILGETDKTKPYPTGYVPEVIVSWPDGWNVRINEPSLVTYIEECSEKDIRLEMDYRLSGIQDSKPVSILGLDTIDKIAEAMSIELDYRRFRPNFYVNWNNNEPFFEDQLVGNSLQVGDDLVIHLVKRSTRCKMVGIDPKKGRFDSKIPEFIAKNYRNRVGVYATVRKPGVVKQGDPIKLAN